MGMILKHPSDRGGSRSQPFERLAENASRFTSSAPFFGICLILVAVAVTLHVIGLPITWLLFMGEAMSAVTLLLVALLKNSELRPVTVGVEPVAAAPAACCSVGTGCRALDHHEPITVAGQEPVQDRSDRRWPRPAAAATDQHPALGRLQHASHPALLCQRCMRHRHQAAPRHRWYRGSYAAAEPLMGILENGSGRSSVIPQVSEGNEGSFRQSVSWHGKQDGRGCAVSRDRCSSGARQRLHRRAGGGGGVHRSPGPVPGLPETSEA
ncbi:hypothetical protein GCM10010103_77960 [Streptomyces paradoxus]